MTKESLESLSKNELIALLLQWSKVNNLMAARLNNLEMENISQREEIRMLKGQTDVFGMAMYQCCNENKTSPARYFKNPKKKWI